MTNVKKEEWRVVALKTQTVEGGVVVHNGDTIPPEVAENIGMTWFRAGYVGFVGVVPEEEIQRREWLDLHNRAIGVRT